MFLGFSKTLKRIGGFRIGASLQALETARDYGGTPIFYKDSLSPIVGEVNMRQETPWEVKR